MHFCCADGEVSSVCVDTWEKQREINLMFTSYTIFYSLDNLDWAEIAHKRTSSGNSRTVIKGRIQTHCQNMSKRLTTLVLVLLDGKPFSEQLIYWLRAWKSDENILFSLTFILKTDKKINKTSYLQETFTPSITHWSRLSACFQASDMEKCVLYLRGT